MANKLFGIADPYYDALRVQSNQAIWPDAGGSNSGLGGVLENKIYVWHADGSTIDTFDPTQAGLVAALAAASGDTVWLPSMTIALTAGVTVPAGVTVQGISEASILSFSGFAGTAVTLSAGSVLLQVSVLYDGTGQANTLGISAIGLDGWVIHRCNFYAHAASGTNYAAEVSGATPISRSFILNSNFHAANGTDAHGIRVLAGGCVTISHSTGFGERASSSNYGLYNNATLTANESIVEHSRFDGGPIGTANLYGVVNLGYARYEHVTAIGATDGLTNQGTARVYAVRWSSLSNSGTVDYATGDRGAWDTATYFNRHASDINDSSFTYHHNPASGTPLGNALTNTHIFVGNVSNVATDVAMSNDATIANTGALTLKNTGPGATGPVGSATVVPIISIDAQGRVTALSSIAISTGSGAINVYNETQTADGVSTIYYLADIANPSTIRVYIDGIRQPATDDTAPTDVVSFSVAPNAGALLLFDYELEII